jgi:hypothetical protein
VEDKPKIDLGRYRNHQRKIPWVLIRKIVILTVIIGLLYCFKDLMKSKEEKINPPEGIEVEIEV